MKEQGWGDGLRMRTSASLYLSSFLALAAGIRLLNLFLAAHKVNAAKDIDHGEWRPEEDSKLLASVHEIGACWSKIAGAMIPHRTDNMCMRRWKRLCQDELPLVIASNQVKKSIFQTNFVYRETERPSIGPSDFPSLVYSKVDRSDENTASDQVKKPQKRSRRSCEDDMPANNPSECSADVAAAKTNMRKSRKKSSGSERKKQTGEDITVSDGANNSSSGYSKARRRKGILESPIGVNNEAPTKQTRGTSSVCKEVTAKKRTGASVSVGNEGAVKKKMRGSISVGNSRIVKNRMRGSVSIDNQGSTAKRNRMSRKAAKDNSATDGVVNACKLDLPSVPSQASAERGIDTENLNKVKRKSTASYEKTFMACSRAGRSISNGKEEIESCCISLVSKLRMMITPRICSSTALLLLSPEHHNLSRARPRL